MNRDSDAMPFQLTYSGDQAAVGATPSSEFFAMNYNTHSPWIDQGSKENFCWIQDKLQLRPYGQGTTSLCLQDHIYTCLMNLFFLLAIY